MWFGKKAQPPIRSLVGEGTVMRGELRFSDGLRIDGEVQGDIACDPAQRSILVISENARVVGKVTAGHVIISGSVIGPVVATELLELQPKARVEGDVRYEVLEMHPGAMIDGEIKPLKAAERPTLTLAAAKEA
jgi:cytoskeletal protein CcmA (bactofilin family)